MYLTIGLSAAALYAAYYCYSLVHKPRVHYHRTQKNSAIVESIPALAQRYFPSFLLSWNRHIHTVITLNPFRFNLKYHHEEVRAPDGVALELVWCDDGVAEDADTMVILPGLTGGAEKWYIKSFVNAVRKQGMRVVVFNFRGCSEALTMNGHSLYNATDVSDIVFILDYIRSKHPSGRMVGAGFSLGANFLVQYLGKVGINTPLTGAVSFSNPFDFNACIEQLETNRFRYHVYNKHFASMFKELIKRNEAQFRKAPGINVDKVLNAKDIREFDQHLTIPAFGFASVDEYYRQSSSRHYISGVKVPVLVLTADDDPVSAECCIPVEELKQNPHIILVSTKLGGHVAWREAFNARSSWADKVAVRFYSTVLQLEESPSSSSS